MAFWSDFFKYIQICLKILVKFQTFSYPRTLFGPGMILAERNFNAIPGQSRALRDTWLRVRVSAVWRVELIFLVKPFSVTMQLFSILSSV